MKTLKPPGLRAGFASLLVLFLLAAGIITAALGFVALLGWILELPRLASFAANLMPMAPSTAVLFLLYGIAIGLRAWTPLSRPTFGINVAAGCVGAMITLLLFVLSCLNIHWIVEHLGMNITGTICGAPVGYMSPVTVFCFLLANVSFLVSLSRSAIRPWRAALALGAAGVLLGTCFIFLLAYLFGAPLLYGGTFIPPALNTILAFTTLSLALLVLAVRSSGSHGGQPGDVRRTSYVFLLIFIPLAAGIISVGYFYYRHYEQSYRAGVERQLVAIAELKMNELTQWRRERLGDAAVLFKNASFSALARRFLEKPSDAAAQRQLLNWMGKFSQYDQYDQLRLLDTQGVTRMSVPASRTEMAFIIAQRIPEVLRANQVVFQDFYRNEHDQRIYLAVTVPILDERDGRPLGVLVLRIDPESYLYPFIKRWPMPSQTAETLLVRREGAEVVFLNELRFQTNTALNLRAPLDRAALPAAQAALAREGVMKGIDYRGVPVVAALRTVPDSPWSLVARMDAAEVYEPMREQLWQITLLISALLFGAGTGVGLLWRQQRIRFYRERAAAAEIIQESEAKFRALFEQAAVGVAQIETATGRYVRVNQKHCDLIGYTREEMERLDFQGITHPDDLAADLMHMERLKAGEIRDFTLEKRYFRKDKSVVWVSLTVSPLWAPGEKTSQHMAVVQDITGRKRAEETLRLSALELREKNAELERFLYTASHDLKSPVVTVRTFLGFLEQDMAAADAARIKKDMSFIRAATDKMGLLLDEVLQVSRIGRTVNPPVRVTFRNLVEEALGAVAGHVAERGAVVKVDEHDMTLHGDRPRLAEIWQNLVENACKFAGGREPRIEIGVRALGAESVFFVRDNGIGIDPRYHTKVFDLFEKLDPKAEGTGIGLALVKRIVEFYQGRIWVESLGKGLGACFYFTLPGAVNHPKEEGKT